MFQSSTYINRRARLKQRIDQGLLLFFGNDENPMNYTDNTYPFRQDSTFLYYFGIQEPKLAAVIDLDDNREVIFGNELSMDDIVWMGRQETLKEKAAKTGITEVLSSKELYPYLQKAQQQGRTVHFLPPYQPGNQLKIWELLGVLPKEQKEKASVELIQAVVAQRSIKGEEEVVEIEKAVNTSVDMHLLAMRLAKPGMTEAEVANAVQQLAQNSGGRLAYPTILSIHGEILHNHKQYNVLQEGKLVVNDSGAETPLGYAGDLTRTFPVSKSFTTKQREIYQIVFDSLKSATDVLAPGVRYLDVHLTACRALVDGLKAIGLMKGDTEEAVQQGAHTLFFQCGTGHMMGLDVHDMEDLGEQYVGYTDTLRKNTTTFGLKSLRLGKELEAGYVLTVEPGIYFIPELFSMWKAENKLSDFINYSAVEQYLDFGGIRIEDDYLITAAGSKKLGKDLAKSVEEVEAIRGQQ